MPARMALPLPLSRALRACGGMGGNLGNRGPAKALAVFRACLAAAVALQSTLAHGMLPSRRRL
eukprot:762390-Alexandrium_andersonii.AAC.1